MKNESTNSKRNGLAQQIATELTDFRNREIDSQTIDWYRQRSSAEMGAVITKLNITDLDLLNVIATNPESRLSDLTEFTNLRQGTISKLVNKFVKLKLVEKYHQGTNLKNTYLRLTDEGQEMVGLHIEFHRENELRLQSALNDFSDTDLEIVTRFLERINDLDGK